MKKLLFSLFIVGLMGVWCFAAETAAVTDTTVANNEQTSTPAKDAKPEVKIKAGKVKKGKKAKKAKETKKAEKKEEIKEDTKK